MSGKRRATKAKTRAPVAGLTAAHADMLVFLSQPHGALFDMAMQYAENAGIKRDLLAYIGISLAAVYLIFGSAARLFCNLIGFGYPMYASAKVIRTKATEDLNMWLIYWTCFAVLLLVDFFSETIFSFFPMYYMFKALFLAYLFLPQTRGTACLYDLLPVYDALGAYASPPRLSTGSDAHHTMEQQTGWSNLPAEMMCEVIKYLDPKSRAQLRATARLENEVVDSNKRKVEVLMVDAYQNGMLVWVDHERFDGSNEEMTYLVISILKTTKVKMLQLFAPRVPTDYWTGFLEKITDGGDLKCPIINMNHFEDLDFELFVKMCAPGTELFHLFRSPEEAFKKVLQDDATKGVMLGASVIQFATMDEDFSRTNDVVEAWIRNDQTIGKKMICWLGSFNDENDWLSDDYETELQPREDRILADFKKMFCDRVVEDKAKSVRIRMEDETKHIVVRMVQEDEGRFTEVYAVWEVIRADMSEDQYEKRSGHLHIEFVSLDINDCRTRIYTQSDDCTAGKHANSARAWKISRGRGTRGRTLDLVAAFDQCARHEQAMSSRTRRMSEPAMGRGEKEEIEEQLKIETVFIGGSFAFIVLFKCRTEVEASGVVTLLAHYQTRVHVIQFGEHIHFSNLPVDFVIGMEVYMMRVPEYKPPEKTCAAYLAEKVRNLLVPNAHRNRHNRTSVSLSLPAQHHPPQLEFKFCGKLTLDRDSAGDRNFLLDDVTYPLEGTVRLQSTCSSLPEAIDVEYRGFLFLFHEQNVSPIMSKGATWHRYWAMLHRGVIFFWKNPLDEKNEQIPISQIDLTKCTNQSIEETQTKTAAQHEFHIELLIWKINGRLEETGTFDVLMKKRGVFFDFMEEYKSTSDSDNTSETSDFEEIGGEKDDYVNPEDVVLTVTNDLDETMRTPELMTQISTLSSPEKSPNTDEKLIKKEDVAQEKVEIATYQMYVKAAGYSLSIAFIVFFILYMTFQILRSFWLSGWSNEYDPENPAKDPMSDAVRLSVYGALGLSETGCFFVALLALVFVGQRASKNLHGPLIHNLMRSPMSFYDTTPLGRILNRCAKDVECIDMLLPMNFRYLVMCVLQVAFTLIVIIISTPLFAAVILPLAIIYLIFLKYYVPTSRQLKRLESVHRSPIYSHFGETIQGAASIRAFNKVDEFRQHSGKILDTFIRCRYSSLVANRWLAVRLEFVGNCIIFFAALFAVLSKEWKWDISPGVIGVSVSYALNITEVLNFAVRQVSEIEANIVSVERVNEYTNTPNEAECRIEATAPRAGWPQRGVVKFECDLILLKLRNFSHFFFEVKDLLCK